MFQVIMRNSGGELERRDVTEGRSIKEVMIRMISECDDLYEGDVFTVESDGEDE